MITAVGRILTGAATLAATPMQTALAAAVEMVGGTPARRSWRGNSRCWIEVRGLQAEEGRRIGAAVLREIRDQPGVRTVQLNYPLSRVIVEMDAAEPDAAELSRLCEAVAKAESQTAVAEPVPRPTDLPGDGILLALKGVAAVANGVGVGVATVGRTVMLPRLPVGLMAVVSAVDYQPKIRALVEARLGPQATDAALGVGAATVYALTQAPAAVAVEFLRHLSQFAETAAAANAWLAHEPRLAAQAECGAVPPVTPRPCALPDGAVERHAQRCGQAQAAAAASVGLLAGNAGAAATAAVVTAPKAARNSREAFASTLGRGVADRFGVLPLRPNSLRLLDRVDTVVVDPRVLVTDALRVGQFRDVAESDRAVVWQWAQDKLDAGALSAGWHRVAPAFVGAERNGRARGRVLVRHSHDPLAHSVLAEIRWAGAQAVSLDLDDLGDLRSSFDDLYQADGDVDSALAGVVEALQRDGRTVAVLSAAAARALGAADFAIGVIGRNPDAAIPWLADILTDDLAAAWCLLHAMPAARRASERGVELATGSTLLGALLMVPGVRGVVPAP